MFSFHFLPRAVAALLQVILIDITLAGDNAIVIGIAASHVPVADRRRVMFWGLVAAITLRLLAAYVVVYILLRTSFFLVFAGGFLLLWVAWRLYREIRGGPAEALGAETIADLRFDDLKSGLPARSADVHRAIFQIAIADLSMSLDNVLAVAGAAMNEPWVLAVGLLLSIALMGLAAAMIARVLKKMPWIGYAGVLIVLYVALRMIWMGGMQILHAA